MRKIIGHMQTTLDGRVARGDGTLWEPFPWGDTEVAYVNETFRRADTLGDEPGALYDAIIPYWHGVATGHPPTDAPPITPAFADFLCWPWCCPPAPGLPEMPMMPPMGIAGHHPTRMIRLHRREVMRDLAARRGVGGPTATLRLPRFTESLALWARIRGHPATAPTFSVAPVHGVASLAQTPGEPLLDGDGFLSRGHRIKALVQPRAKVLSVLSHVPGGPVAVLVLPKAL
jgi:hypothetical protein